MDLNRASLIGRMATDPEVRMAGDKPVCNFRLVTNYKVKDENRAEYHNAVCWGKNAENVGTFLARGSKVYIDGRLQTREWTANDGQKKQTTEIVVDNIIFLDKPDKQERSVTYTTAPSAYSVTGVTGTNATELFVLENMDKTYE